MRLIAHRGRVAPDPENAVESIEGALTACVGVEIDVRIAADGVPVLHHDAGLLRVFGRPERIAALASEDLKHRLV